MKFYNEKFSISKSYADNLREKRRIFREVTKTNKQIFLVILTTFGLIQNEHSMDLVSESLDLDALFLAQ